MGVIKLLAKIFINETKDTLKPIPNHLKLCPECDGYGNGDIFNLCELCEGEGVVRKRFTDS